MRTARWACAAFLALPIVTGCSSPSPLERAVRDIRGAGGQFVLETRDGTSIPVGVSFVQDNRADDATLNLLGELQTLRFVTLTNAPVSDRGLEALARLPKLETLVLRNLGNVSDQGLAVLPRLPALKTVRIYNASFTDEAVRHVGAAEGLEEIDIQLVPITDAGLAHLQRLPALKRLTVKFTRISDDALREFHERRPEVVIRF